MKKLLAPFLLIFVVGCAGFPIPNTDRQNLAAAEITFTAAVEQLTELKNSGDLEGNALLNAQRVVAAGSAALDGAHAAIAAGNQDNFNKWFAAFEEAIAELKRTLPDLQTETPT